MSEHVPAWKRIGLKVKQELEQDPLSVTTHLDNVNVTSKELKKINKQKRKLEESNKEKKPPKRVKLPKSERPPPPERDQLVYLNQYYTDKDNWKFSKQKQNWILKNIASIPGDYEKALKAYLEGLQGGSRTRVIEDLQKVVEKWNKLAQLAEEKIEKEILEKAKGEAKEEKDEKKSDPKEEEKESVDYDYAVRCRDLLEVLTGDVPVLKGVEEKKDTEEEKEEKKEEEAKIEVQEQNEEEKEEEEEEGSKKSDAPQDNLIIESVDVGSGHSEISDKPKKSKKSKKAKKAKKSKTE